MMLGEESGSKNFMPALSSDACFVCVDWRKCVSLGETKSSFVYIYVLHVKAINKPVIVGGSVFTVNSYSITLWYVTITV
jgi:hypothetical protein